MYQALDLMEAGPERINELLQELVELFEYGSVQPFARSVGPRMAYFCKTVFHIQYVEQPFETVVLRRMMCGEF